MNLSRYFGLKSLQSEALELVAAGYPAVYRAKSLYFPHQLIICKHLLLIWRLCTSPGSRKPKSMGILISEVTLENPVVAAGSNLNKCLNHGTSSVGSTKGCYLKFYKLMRHLICTMLVWLSWRMEIVG